MGEPAEALLEIFERRCTECHFTTDPQTGSVPPGRLDLQSPGALERLSEVPASSEAARERGWLRVAPGDTAKSLLYLQLRGRTQAKGLGHNLSGLSQISLPASEILLIRDWILDGAPLRGEFNSLRDETKKDTRKVEVRYPNPYRPGNPILLKVERNKVDVSVKVHGMDGSLLRTLQGKLEEGEIEFNWDGRDRGGKALPSGSYILTVDGGRRPFQSLLFLST